MHIQLMSFFLIAGFLVSWLQSRHLKKNFLTPGQFRLVSAVGILCFLAAVFVAIKGLFD